MATQHLHFNYRKEWSYPVDIVAGIDAISEMGEALDKLGLKRAMVLCGPGTSRSGIVERIQAALGERFVGVYSGVGFNGPGGQHIPEDILGEAAALARDWKPDVLLALGGGRAGSTSKALTAALADGGAMPVITVPTTISCAEISATAGRCANSPSLRAFLIVDGKALATTPVRILHSTVFSQFRIAVECICSKTHNPISDALALHGIRQLMHCAPRLAERDPEVLVAAKLAGCLPSLARFHAVNSAGLSTAVCHQAGGLYDIPHGEIHGIMLPHTMRFNLDATAEQQALIAEAMGIDTSGLSAEEAGLAAAEGVTALCKTLGLPTTLREVGVPREAAEAIASATLSGESAIKTNPKPILGIGTIVKVLQAAW